MQAENQQSFQTCASRAALQIKQATALCTRLPSCEQDGAQGQSKHSAGDTPRFEHTGILLDSSGLFQTCLKQDHNISHCHQPPQGSEPVGQVLQAATKPYSTWMEVGVIHWEQLQAPRAHCP